MWFHPRAVSSPSSSSSSSSTTVVSGRHLDLDVAAASVVRRHVRSIDEIARAIRSGWAADTAWIDDWDERNAPRGQCGSSALVLQDLRGGSLLRGRVAVDGDEIVHYWNVLDLGQVDLTWHQFPTHARFVHSEVVERAEMLPTRWFADRAALLRIRADDALARFPA
jgi:hypothetical protein